MTSTVACYFCVSCVRADDKKEVWKGCVMDMRDSVEELKNTSIRARISARGGAVAGQYSTLAMALHKAVWILKVRCRAICNNYKSIYNILTLSYFNETLRCDIHWNCFNKTVQMYDQTVIP